MTERANQYPALAVERETDVAYLHIQETTGGLTTHKIADHFLFDVDNNGNIIGIELLTLKPQWSRGFNYDQLNDAVNETENDG